MLFFEFPEDARWNDDRDEVEFSVILPGFVTATVWGTHREQVWPMRHDPATALRHSAVASARISAGWIEISGGVES
jgi:hypothetical protein